MYYGYDGCGYGGYGGGFGGGYGGCGYGGFGWGAGSFALIVVLFILLIIIGASFTGRDCC